MRTIIKISQELLKSSDIRDATIESRQELIAKSLTEITNNRAIGIGLCYHSFEALDNSSNSVSNTSSKKCGLTLLLQLVTNVTRAITY